MTELTNATVTELNLDAIADLTGRVAVFVDEAGKLDQAGRRVNRLTKGALARLVASEAFEKTKTAGALEMAFPAGMAADAVQVVKLTKRAPALDARAAGATIGKAKKGKDVSILAGNLKHVGELALGVLLRDYAFTDHKTGEETTPADGGVTLLVSAPEAAAAAFAEAQALASGVFFTRDLVSEPSNVLTTTEFANRLQELESLGIEVEVLDEPVLERLGMRTLLGVGQGSVSPSKVVVMQWKGGQDEAPFALVGKGVVFDTGGISLKPAGGMEDMTMDMGGAGVVSGVMKTLALRKAKANVVGLVGLVENMPDGNAQRPGDVVTSMKGDTVEVINTDAEGRLVLCDVLWYAQDRFAPTGMVDLATLTGAIVIGLGHENAGVFSNNDALCNAFLKAAGAEQEGAWRMPLGDAYDELLKSDVADMKNIGGRAAGSVTAAQFLQRFVKEDTPWIHLDIAGVASTPKETAMAPKGASGWGILALNRLIADGYEG
ncbi:Cytosol aminopeptidase PepA [Candidatus Rhodobacter oscarellae]|uniref:Probable cytosol aminopeptidase n=1 Tax=Candidatus Rhodobacter oscarellae TaxID=1675527 RepID=A0A0J9E0I9_9RHOB|nr:leucyl aminopeptidase [Candidatus Rhodobacter lobularis]KMW56235.1 Cytosol aminopeptidase PepA [Candidatus Rhodobacter lobularis]